MWLHGGAWMMRPEGDRSAKAYQRHGLEVVPATYRLSGEARWPAQLADVRAAAREIMAGDPDVRLLVAGHSAGAHLALHLALRGVNRPGDVAAVIAASPPTDPLAADWPESREAGSPWARLLGQVPAAGDPATADVTVANHVGTGVPVLLLHGADDQVVPPTQTLDLANALLAAGHPVTAYLCPGGHDLRLDDADVEQVVAAFLRGPAAG
ncbi:hypothetical protein Sru01_00160 [Sphaerisporangium rufum]|uniref:BD-FAE-like domain-containing protein n=2 Tax=Sphaerisporangium rufum TaxID=1381558 RepID=A0A919QVW4_9ACTN|nr:hypothetical protein Sru01_00160 [Sphaerisporangium rufum]